MKGDGDWIDVIEREEVKVTIGIIGKTDYGSTC